VKRPAGRGLLPSHHMMITYKFQNAGTRILERINSGLFKPEKETNLADGHEVKVGLPVPHPNVGHLVAQLFHDGLLLVAADEHAGLHHEPGGLAVLANLQLRADDLVSAEEGPGEGLHHDPGAGRDDVPLAEGVEHPPALRVHVAGVELGQHRARHHLDVAHLEPRHGDVHQRADGQRLGEEDVGDVDERHGQEQQDGAEDAAGLQRHEEVVGERAPGDEQRAVQVGGHRLLRPPLRAALLDGLEPPRHHLGWLLRSHSLTQQKRMKKRLRDAVE
jgi:hypothetical protein